MFYGRQEKVGNIRYFMTDIPESAAFTLEGISQRQNFLASYTGHLDARKLFFLRYLYLKTEFGLP